MPCRRGSWKKIDAGQAAIASSTAHSAAMLIWIVQAVS